MSSPIVLVQPEEKVYGLCPLMHPGNMKEALKFTERVGRVAYKSEDKITEDSAEGFIKRMLKQDPPHMSVTEFSNIIVQVANPSEYMNMFLNHHSKYLKVVQCPCTPPQFLIGGSIRAWMEAMHIYNLDYMFDNIIGYMSQFGSEISFVTSDKFLPKELQKFLVWFKNDRAFTHELVRHRVMSFLQESQRYVKYDTGIEIIRPGWFKSIKESGEEAKFFTLPDLDLIWNCWTDIETVANVFCEELTFLLANMHAAKSYMGLREAGMHQQSARGVLTNATKTEIFVMGDFAGWTNLYNLRTGAGAHPEMKFSMARLDKNESFRKFLDL